MEDDDLDFKLETYKMGGRVFLDRHDLVHFLKVMRVLNRSSEINRDAIYMQILSFIDKHSLLSEIT